MLAATPLTLRKRVRRLTALCLMLWLGITLVPVLIARRNWSLPLGNWPLDFWMAAQGCVLVYLLIVALYAGLVNRWERQAGELSFEIPPDQDV
jgi:putative solute:sodium symporter small subunit